MKTITVYEAEDIAILIAREHGVDVSDVEVDESVTATVIKGAPFRKDDAAKRNRPASELSWG